MTRIRKITVGVWEVNCYTLSDEYGSCILIDPGEAPATIDEKLVIPNRHRPIAIIATHGHLDHIGGAKYFTEKYAAPLYVHERDIELAKNATFWANVFGTPGITDPEKIERLCDGVMTIDKFFFEIIHTPGHTGGGICLYLKEMGVVFTGDSLFYRAVGRSDRPGLDAGGHYMLLESIRQRLFGLPDKTIVFPGHGRITTIGYERQHNPFLT
ncbi:MAG: MBL fold metallo-hydrolase [Nitrospirae bacterium]|nr:MAG: MBL fold metallo-hydrolase [Nitrospirota bacterium]